MAEARSDQEPSIEEILASIREIISDDEPSAKEEPAPEPAPIAIEPDDADDDDDILDLASFAEKAEEAPIFNEPADLTVDFTDPLADEIAQAPEPEPEPEIEEPVFVAPEKPVAPIEDRFLDESDSLLTDTAKAASMDALNRLAQNIAISRAGQGGTLEDIVREMVKPMLRDWLDRNLPPMIERMVERELQSLVKKALDR